MRNNKLRPQYIIPAAIFLMLLIYFFVIRDKEAPLLVEQPKETVTVIETSPHDNKPTPKAVEERPVIKGSDTLTKKYLDSVGFQKSKFDYLIEQDAMKKRFKKKVKIHIDLPPHLDYIELDMEDSVAAIYGSNSASEQEFAMLATDKKVNVEDVMQYLKDSADALPLIKSHTFQPDKMATVKAPESTGLGNLKIIPSSESDGKGAFAAIAERKDGKGTYLFLMEAPSPYFDQNEEGLELMLKSIKTKP